MYVLPITSRTRPPKFSRLQGTGSIIALSFQHRASYTPFSLNSLRFVNSAFALRYDWNLPFQYLTPLVLFIAFSLVPAAVWSGAITPNIVGKNVTISFSIPMVRHVNQSQDSLPSRSIDDGDCPWLIGGRQDDAQTNFGNCFDKLALLQSAAATSSLSKIPSSNGKFAFDLAPYSAKLDRSGYYYIGRNYGIGSTVGLIDIPEVKHPLSYTFVESGLYMDVSCIVNKTSNYTMYWTGEANGWQYWADPTDGVLPEGLDIARGGGATHVVRLAMDAFSWGTAFNPRSRTTWFALTAANSTLCDNVKPGDKCGYGFPELNQTQCRIQFTPKEFQVSVDTVLRSITVNAGKTVEWPTYADDLLAELAVEHNIIAFTDGSLGGSQLGHALRSNVAVARATLNETTFSKETMLHAVQEFIANIMDNSYMSFMQAQYFGHKAKGQVNAEVSRNVAVYGKAKFVYAAVLLNFLIFGMCIAEAIRTRFWKDISAIDLLDTASIAVGASYGGTKLAAHMQAKGMNASRFPGPRPSVRGINGAVKLRLRNFDGSICALEPAGSHGGVEEDSIPLTSFSTGPSQVGRHERAYVKLSTTEVD